MPQIGHSAQTMAHVRDDRVRDRHAERAQGIRPQDDLAVEVVRYIALARVRRRARCSSCSRTEYGASPGLVRRGRPRWSGSPPCRSWRHRHAANAKSENGASGQAGRDAFASGQVPLDHQAGGVDHDGRRRGTPGEADELDVSPGAAGLRRVKTEARVAAATGTIEPALTVAAWNTRPRSGRFVILAVQLGGDGCAFL
jgi:hypothetical protein